MQPEQGLVYAASGLGCAVDLAGASLEVVCGLNLPQRGRLPIISRISLANLHTSKTELLEGMEFGNKLFPGAPGGRHLTKK
jgi:hypothetical protein